MGIQIRPSLLLEEGKELLPEEGLYFYIYIYFYWSHLTSIHVFDCSGGVILCAHFYICTMVIWRGNFIVFHHVSWSVISHLCCWFHTQDNCFQVWYWRCYISLKGYGLILMIRISMMILLTSFFVLVLLSSGDVMIFLAWIFVGVLTLICSILVVECIYKVPVDKRVNHWVV